MDLQLVEDSAPLVENQDWTILNSVIFEVEGKGLNEVQKKQSKRRKKFNAMKSMLFQLILWVLLGVGAKPAPKPLESVKTQFRVYFFLSEGCPMCQGYAGTLHDLAVEYGAKGVTFIGVFPNYYASDTAIQAFKKKYDIPFKLQRDQGFRFTNHFNAQITPQVFLTDEKNVVLYAGMIDNTYYKAGKRRGVTSDFYLKKALDNVLNHQAVELKETKPIGCVIVRN